MQRVVWGNENPEPPEHSFSLECVCINCEIKRENLIEDARDIMEEQSYDEPRHIPVPIRESDKTSDKGLPETTENTETNEKKRGES